MISNDFGDTGGMRRRKIGNICQQYHARAIVLKLALQQVIGHRIGLQGFRQLPIGIRLPDGAKQVELFHQTTDFLHIHNDGRIHVEQLHIDAAGALLVPSSFVSGKDQFKVLAVLFFLGLPKCFRLHPGIITASGHACHLA